MNRGFAIVLLVSFILVANDLTAKEKDLTPPPPSQTLPSAQVPDGLGVNIHFTDPQAGEMKMIDESGVRWVRIDLIWVFTEKEKGKYDFASYDHLFTVLEPYKIRALIILAYSNPLYDQGVAPHTEEGRRAFARWVSAAVKRYAGKGVVWELWNEPNVPFFWPPQANAKDYTELAVAVGKTIREDAPHEIYVGPATSHVDLNFIEECFKGGLLNYWDAVTVHPYRRQGPETWAKELDQLRDLIKQFAPSGKHVPVLSGEWGYSDIDWRMGEARQAKLLARQCLFNLSEKVPLSIWYDWRDDGQNTKDPEHHFGMVRNIYRADKNPVFEPKPAYQAAQTLTRQLEGFQFFRKYSGLRASDFVLLFKKENDLRMIAWTTDRKPHRVFIPASSGTLQVIDHLGQKKSSIFSSSKGFYLELTDGPQYLRPEKPEALLRKDQGALQDTDAFVATDLRGCPPPNSPEWRCRQH